MTADLIGWHDEQAPDHRRRLRNAMIFSVALHGSLFATFAIAPSRPVVPMPEVLAVELVAGPPAGARAPRARPAPKPAPPAPTKAPDPPAPPPPAPPVAKAPVQVLPEESPGRIRKAKPEAETKVPPKPKPEPVVRPKKEEALSYDDAMAELGLDETEEFLEALPGAREEEASSAEPAASTGGEVSQAGAQISPELAAWNLATKRLIQRKWVTPSNLRNRGFVTQLRVRLSLSGELIGGVEVVRSSGDIYFDDNAVKAVLTAAPLPPPPKPGIRVILFRSEEN